MSDHNDLPSPSEAPPSGLPALVPPLVTMVEEHPVEPDVPSGASRAMWSVLDRLEQALDHETAELMALRSADFNRLNEIKSRLLLDASRAMRAMRDEVADGRLIARLSTLRLKLEHNRLAIGMHLDAVREIASAMTSTLIDAESDGTYSANSRIAGARNAKAQAS
ncbi:MAG TPA: hypothetical protein VGN82_04630 [Bosea sp. (in: a-proteobacteria)]|jgi:hypothetical protein|uniref:hypothetical protein n=1 Tax=Bosea sp. (in: a-proteobacteria) TaxID=1871050 RepID=UPI002E104F1A|nr:hypothetical protein [Bosea sp. (in: a-proteobacteria)]